MLRNGGFFGVILFAAWMPLQARSGQPQLDSARGRADKANAVLIVADRFQKGTVPDQPPVGAPLRENRGSPQVVSPHGRP